MVNDLGRSFNFWEWFSNSGHLGQENITLGYYSPSIMWPRLGRATQKPSPAGPTQLYFIYHFLPKFNFKKLKKYYKSSQFFVLKLYHTYSLRHMFYLLGKLSLRATQSLWNGNNWRTSIMGSENNKRIYISYTYTMLKYGTSKAFSQSITLKRVKQVKN